MKQALRAEREVASSDLDRWLVRSPFRPTPALDDDCTIQVAGPSWHRNRKCFAPLTAAAGDDGAARGMPLYPVRAYHYLERIITTPSDLVIFRHTVVAPPMVATLCELSPVSAAPFFSSVQWMEHACGPLPLANAPRSDACQ